MNDTIPARLTPEQWGAVVAALRSVLRDTIPPDDPYQIRPLVVSALDAVCDQIGLDPGDQE